jgi:hypothetical protein
MTKFVFSRSEKLHRYKRWTYWVSFHLIFRPHTQCIIRTALKDDFLVDVPYDFYERNEIREIHSKLKKLKKNVYFLKTHKTASTTLEIIMLR